jgi:phenylpropionate dioxygenase-like ring-hydroxylating dioxygenase large terminal subunit
LPSICETFSAANSRQRAVPHCSDSAFAEDKRVLEAQQRVLDSRPDSWDLALRSDAGSIESRRVLQDLIDREQAAMADAA